MERDEDDDDCCGLNIRKEQVWAPERIDGVVIGILVGLDESGEPRVAYSGNPGQHAVAARSTVALTRDKFGRQVALLFEGGDPSRPLIVGFIQHPESRQEGDKATPLIAEIDGGRLVLNAEEEIVLRCGKASITLTKAGKVLIRGEYILSRSSGVNRIKGGSVQLN